MQTLVLVGDLNATLCEGAASEDDIPYVLSFSGVLAVRVLELDSLKDRPASSFDEIVDSPWLADLGGKVGPKHRHFAFQTYDTVFDVICVTMTFETKPRGAGA